MNRNRCQPVPFTSQEMGAVFSPDGRCLACGSGAGLRLGFEVYVEPFPPTGGGRRQVSQARGLMPGWSSDGTELFYRPLTIGEVDRRQTLKSVRVTMGCAVERLTIASARLMALLRFPGRSQAIDATLYPKRKGWSVCEKGCDSVSRRRRRRRYGIGGGEGNLCMRSVERLASCHRLFIVNWRIPEGFVLNHDDGRGWL